MLSGVVISLTWLYIAFNWSQGFILVDIFLILIIISGILALISGFKIYQVANIKQISFWVWLSTIIGGVGFLITLFFTIPSGFAANLTFQFLLVIIPYIVILLSGVTLLMFNKTKLTFKKYEKGQNSALDTLKERYSSGEITRSKYLQMKKDLGE